jgi:hypothetical protein
MAGKKAAPKKKAAEEESAGKKETSKGGKGGEKEVKVPHKPAFKRHAAEEPEEKGVAEQQWNAAQWLESLGMATHSNGHRTDHHHVLTIRAHPLHVLPMPRSMPRRAARHRGRITRAPRGGPEAVPVCAVRDRDSK